VIFLVALPAGVYFAIRPKAAASRGLSLLFLLFYSMPSFWIGLLLILTVARLVSGWPITGLETNLPPDAGYWSQLADTAWRSVLPVFCLSFGSFAFLSRITRTSLLEVIRQDYVRTARAKGLSEFDVIVYHVLRNGLITLITVFVGMLPGLIGGSILVEYLFNIHGMGTLSIDALSSRDYPLLMTLFAMSGVLTLIAILVTDIFYALADPTIRLDK
jgi:peptide/nickel transport system permease protein